MAKNPAPSATLQPILAQVDANVRQPGRSETRRVGVEPDVPVYTQIVEIALCVGDCAIAEKIS
jgi:hypothetical protein